MLSKWIKNQPKEADVLKLFYRVELRKDEEIIDNRTSTIAKELELHPGEVSWIISEHLKDKFNKLDIQKNEDYKIRTANRNQNKI